MSMKKQLAGMALMGLALSGMSGQQIPDVGQKEKPRLIYGYHPVVTRSQKDRANTIKRMKINQRRKKYGLPVLRSQSRFGGYRIPAI